MTDEQTPSRRRMVVHAVVALAIVGAAILGVSVLFSTAPEISSRQRPKRSATLVEIIEVTQGAHQLKIRASGLSMPAESLEVIPQVSGQVVSVNKELVPGRIIKKGATIATIERRDFQLAVMRAQSSVAQAKATLALEAGNQDLAKLEAKYLDDLVTEKNKDLILRGPQLATAEATLAAANVELDQAKLNLSRTRIRAPFDALVLTRDVAIGRTVNSQSAIASLAGVGQWWIRAEVPVGELQGLRPGSPATVSFPSSWGEATREAEVIQSNGQVESRGRLGSVLIAVENPLARGDDSTPSMLINTRYDVELFGNVLESAVVLETGWIRGENEVWLMNESGTLEKRTVTIAHRDSNRAVITTGLTQGDRLITSSLASPVEGMELRLDGENEKGVSPTERRQAPTEKSSAAEANNGGSKR